MLSISLMFHTLKFMLFSGLTPREGTPKQHHGPGPHGLAPALMASPCQQQPWCHSALQGGGRWNKMTSPTQGSVTCVLWLWGQPRGTQPCRPRAGLAWVLHTPGMLPTLGPAHLWGLRGLGALGQSLGLTPGLRVPGPHLRAGGPWGQSRSEGPWGHPKLRVPDRTLRPEGPMGVSVSHPRAEGSWISQGWISP